MKVSDEYQRGNKWVDILCVEVIAANTSDKESVVEGSRLQLLDQVLGGLDVEWGPSVGKTWIILRSSQDVSQYQMEDGMGEDVSYLLKQVKSCCSIMSSDVMSCVDGSRSRSHVWLGQVMLCYDKVNIPKGHVDKQVMSTNTCQVGKSRWRLMTWGGRRPRLDDKMLSKRKLDEKSQV